MYVDSMLIVKNSNKQYGNGILGVLVIKLTFLFPAMKSNIVPSAVYSLS